MMTTALEPDVRALVPRCDVLRLCDHAWCRRSGHTGAVAGITVDVAAGGVAGTWRKNSMHFV
jgi:hypothetical protein